MSELKLKARPGTCWPYGHAGLRIAICWRLETVLKTTGNRLGYLLRPKNSNFSIFPTLVFEMGFNSKNWIKNKKKLELMDLLSENCCWGTENSSKMFTKTIWSLRSQRVSTFLEVLFNLLLGRFCLIWWNRRDWTIDWCHEDKER